MGIVHPFVLISISLLLGWFEAASSLQPSSSTTTTSVNNDEFISLFKPEYAKSVENMKPTQIVSMMPTSTSSSTFSSSTTVAAGIVYVSNCFYFV